MVQSIQTRKSSVQKQPKGKKSKCEICSVTVVDLKDHMTSKHEKAFKCEICGKGFDRQQRMELHQTTVHLEQKNFECQKCGKKYQNLSSLNRHRKGNCLPKGRQEDSEESSPGDETDDVTDQLSEYSGELNDDAKVDKMEVEVLSSGEEVASKEDSDSDEKGSENNNNDESDNECKTCGKTFNNTKKLLGHLSSVHSGVKKYECEVCGMRFALSSTCKRHKKSHDKVGKGGFKCDLCGRMYVRLISLKKHKLTTHSDQDDEESECESLTEIIKSFNFDDTEMKERKKGVCCPICGKAFGWKTDLNVHFVNAHQIEEVNLKNEKIYDETEKEKKRDGKIEDMVVEETGDKIDEKPVKVKIETDEQVEDIERKTSVTEKVKIENPVDSEVKIELKTETNFDEIRVCTMCRKGYVHSSSHQNVAHNPTDSRCILCPKCCSKTLKLKSRFLN